MCRSLAEATNARCLRSSGRSVLDARVVSSGRGRGMMGLVWFQPRLPVDGFSRLPVTFRCQPALIPVLEAKYEIPTHLAQPVNDRFIADLPIPRTTPLACIAHTNGSNRPYTSTRWSATNRSKRLTVLNNRTSQGHHRATIHSCTGRPKNKPVTSKAKGAKWGWLLRTGCQPVVIKLAMVVTATW